MSTLYLNHSQFRTLQKQPLEAPPPPARTHTHTYTHELATEGQRAQQIVQAQHCGWRRGGGGGGARPSTMALTSAACAARAWPWASSSSVLSAAAWASTSACARCPNRNPTEAQSKPNPTFLAHRITGESTNSWRWTLNEE